MADSYDIIIVGGGPAGSTLAWSLEGTGLKTLIIDKQQFPRDKTCAGWVTPGVLESLRVDIGDYANGRVIQPIHGFRIGMMGQAAVENDHGREPVSYGIRRCEFDHYLLERTRAEKALGEPVKSLEKDGRNWVVNGHYQAPLLVGAGGHFCPVARELGDGPGRHEMVVAAKEVEFEMTPEQTAHCGVREDQPELWFCDDLKGYAWVFRKGNFLNIGLGREDNHRLGDHLQAFVEQMQADGRIPADIPGRFKGHAYLLYDHAQRPLVGDGIMLIGDAAGLAYTQSGEGIRPAIESALMAAGTINRTPDYQAANLASYEAAIAERFGQRNQGEKPGWDIPHWAKTRIAARLMRSHWFTRHVVTNRWFLHAQVPTLKAG